MKTYHIVIVLVILASCFAGIAIAGMNRYPVGQAVPVEIYTSPFDPCDPAYKFLQPPPEDWAKQFGNNERTCLIQSISELRIVVAQQSRVLADLKTWRDAHDPNSLPGKAGDAEPILGSPGNAPDPNEVTK